MTASNTSKCSALTHVDLRQRSVDLVPGVRRGPGAEVNALLLAWEAQRWGWGQEKGWAKEASNPPLQQWRPEWWKDPPPNTEAPS